MVRDPDWQYMGENREGGGTATPLPTCGTWYGRGTGWWQFTYRFVMIFGEGCYQMNYGGGRFYTLPPYAS